ncbi:MAG: 6-carboxytetrahydropterin synthase [Planctomycetota bacterium]
MYELTVEARFSAAHAIMISGTREPVHGHDWLVTATIAGDELDADGLLCDFHTVEDTLKNIVRPFRSMNLNEVAPFDTVNPTAELVAKHIFDELHDRLDAALAPHATVRSVRVTEAPGCAATYVNRSAAGRG